MENLKRQSDLKKQDESKVKEITQLHEYITNLQEQINDYLSEIKKSEE